MAEQQQPLGAPAPGQGPSSGQKQQAAADPRKEPQPPADAHRYESKAWSPSKQLTDRSLAHPPVVVFTKSTLESLFGWQHGSSRQICPTVVFRCTSPGGGAATELEPVQLLPPSRDDKDVQDRKREGGKRARVDGYPVPTAALKKLLAQLFGGTSPAGRRLHFRSAGWRGTQLVLDAAHEAADVEEAAGEASEGEAQEGEALQPAPQRSMGAAQQQHIGDASQESQDVVDLLDDSPPFLSPQATPAEVPVKQEGQQQTFSSLGGLAAAAAEAFAAAASAGGGAAGRPQPLMACLDSLQPEARAIVQAAHGGWLQTDHVHQLMVHFEALGVPMIEQQPIRPKAGDLFLANKQRRFDRGDGHDWTDRRSNKLKVDGEEVLQVVYFTTRDGKLQRRAYHFLPGCAAELTHLQLLHYQLPPSVLYFERGKPGPKKHARLTPRAAPRLLYGVDGAGRCNPLMACLDNLQPAARGIVQAAHAGWLTTDEVHQLMANFDSLKVPWTTQQPIYPEAGDLFLADRQWRFERGDGHDWVDERSDKLTVGGQEVLRVVYHNTPDGKLQRRAYHFLKGCKAQLYRLHLLHYQLPEALLSSRKAEPGPRKRASNGQSERPSQRRAVSEPPGAALPQQAQQAAQQQQQQQPPSSQAANAAGPVLNFDLAVLRRASREGKIWAECVEIMDSTILDTETLAAFGKPVDPCEAPDAALNPIDLGTILNKLLATPRGYSSPLQLRDDVRLTFANCRLFNPEGTSVRKLGDAASARFETEWTAAQVEARWEAHLRLCEQEDQQRQGASAQQQQQQQQPGGAGHARPAAPTPAHAAGAAAAEAAAAAAAAEGEAAAAATLSPQARLAKKQAGPGERMYTGSFDLPDLDGEQQPAASAGQRQQRTAPAAGRRQVAAAAAVEAREKGESGEQPSESEAEELEIGGRRAAQQGQQAQQDTAQQAIARRQQQDAPNAVLRAAEQHRRQQVAAEAARQEQQAERQQQRQQQEAAEAERQRQRQEAAERQRQQQEAAEAADGEAAGAAALSSQVLSAQHLAGGSERLYRGTFSFPDLDDEL